MKYLLYILIALLFNTYMYSQSEDDAHMINAAGLLSGSYMLKTPASFTPTNLMGGEIQNFSPEALFDQSDKMWCSQKRTNFPYVFEIELTETFTISKLVFNNICEDYKGIGVNEIKVEYSNSVSGAGYKSVGAFSLKEQKLNVFEVDDIIVRRFKLTILSNHGHKYFTEIAEFEAWGKPKLSEINTIDIDGVWQSNWGSATFHQNGTLFDGSYEYMTGKILYGGINRNQLTFKWDQMHSSGEEGQTLLFLNEEGTRLSGIWCFNNNWNTYGFWIFYRNQGTPFEAYEAKEMEAPIVENAIVSAMKKELNEKKRIILYGINFKTNSAELLPESYMVLRQIAELLIQQPDLKISVEGHTDNVGTSEYNKSLSEQRASVVKEYLVSTEGIATGSVVAVGYGEEEPIASNDSEMGRAANRRVEIKQIE